MPVRVRALRANDAPGHAGPEACSNPDKRIYSLESLGVNVADLCKKAFDLDLEWTSDGRTAGHVCAVGAVFFSDEDEM